jgi:hypothetical protein
VNRLDARSRLLALVMPFRQSIIGLLTLTELTADMAA